MWIVNYKITVKSAFSRERRHLRQIHELKTMLARSTLLCKLDSKAANAGQTDRHTHTKYCNPLAHARRALIRAVIATPGTRTA